MVATHRNTGCVETGREVNVVRKSPTRVLGRIAYIFPSLYNVMISSLATDLIYFLVNRREDVYLERFCVKRLRGVEDAPRSIETMSPLRDFGLYISSIHYEPDIVNLVSLLEAGGVSPLRESREKILVLGGPGVMANPVPFSDIADVVVIGEVEETLDKIIDLWIEYGDDKKRFLEEVSGLSFVYVPEYPERTVVRAYTRDLNNAFYPTRQVENTDVEPVYGRGYKLEISRGCKFWCSFCIESRLFQPYRERSLATIKSLLERGLEHSISGRRVVIYSLLTPASREQIRLLEYLVNEGFRASIPSVRLGHLVYSTEFLELVKMLGQRTLTIAPETFSMRIQKTYFKYMSPLESLVDSILEVVERGFDTKIYIIYGAKWESEDDLRETIEALRKIARYSRERGRRVSVSINPLIPRPKTMLQWIGMRSIEELETIQKLFVRELRGLVEARPLDIVWAFIQASISMSDRPLGRLLVEWSRSGRSPGAWKRILRERGVDTRYVFEGYKFSEELAWDKILIGEKVEEVAATQYRVFLDLVSRYTGVSMRGPGTL